MIGAPLRLAPLHNFVVRVFVPGTLPVGVYLPMFLRPSRRQLSVETELGGEREASDSPVDNLLHSCCKLSLPLLHKRIGERIVGGLLLSLQSSRSATSRRCSQGSAWRRGYRVNGLQ